MNESGISRNIFLFSLYFLFHWIGQISSGRVVEASAFFNMWMLLMYGCLFSRAAVWFLILKEMDLIKAYALSSVNFLVIPLLSRLFLGEILQLKYLFGALLIIPGILLFALGEKKNHALSGEVANT